MSAKKKKIIIVFAVIIIVLVLMFIASLILEHYEKKLRDPKIELDYEFYVPLEDENYFNDPAYMIKDRTLHYTDSMGQQWIIDDQSNYSDIGGIFFQLYFLALEQGDSEILNSLYKEELGKFDDFTPQRIYQKEVKYLYDEKIDDTTYSITYSVDYNIMKNDGSFRRDIGSDMSRTQYITLYYTSEETWIEEVKTEYKK